MSCFDCLPLLESVVQTWPLFDKFMTNIVQSVTIKVKVEMVCLGFEHGTAGSYAQTNPLSYGSPTRPLINLKVGTF